MRKILIVDDALQIRQLIKKYASYEGFEVMEADNGVEAVDLALVHAFDIIVLDLMMPEMNGFDACRLIREETDTPIIMLTARDADFDKYQGFELGVDDYMTKPFSPRELFYRVEAILKRGRIVASAQEYTFEGLSLNFTAHALYIDKQFVELSPKEYDLLHFLVENRGIALERDQIINKVWGYDFDGDERTLDTHIKRLRRKLGQYQSLVMTIRGVGYRFDG